MSSQNIANLTVQDLLNIVNNNKQVPQPASSASASASASVTATIHELSFYNLSAEVTTLPIPKQSARSKLQSILGLKNQKERWLRYLVCIKFLKHVSNFVMSLFVYMQEIMRDCVLEKGVTFEKSYREQKSNITSGIICAFKKKVPNFPPSMADWAIKDLLIKHIQRSRKIGQVNNSNEDIVISDIEETEEIDVSQRSTERSNRRRSEKSRESKNHDSEIDDNSGNQRFVNKNNKLTQREVLPLNESSGSNRKSTKMNKDKQKK
ncbi:hypothetical protein RclHR1_03230015 [Rhizophagus clarus]|uniref:Uncharacterized protein n=1 Tax=Rhizophagus clarus TaxID=94130 RepID=A0A2Z6R824_9GLOM|nr:hypothetical protein RclHR1_03230015 [Rhizophagus clarus]